MVSDIACITCKRKNSYIGISQLFGKTKFNIEGIRIKFPALTVGFFIEYEIHDKYNFYSKNYLHPQSISLNSCVNYEGFSFSIQLIFALYTELATTEIENEALWNIFESLKVKKKTKEFILSKIINLINIITGNNIKENEIHYIENSLIKIIQFSVLDKEKSVFLQKMIKYVFKYELRKIKVEQV
jgi:hypothetical protein